MTLLTGLGVDLVFVLGAALLIALVRWWRPAVSLRAAALYGALVTAFFAGSLLTGGLQVPTDIAYHTHPWREAARGKVRPLNPLLSDIVLEELPFHTLVRERLLRFEAPLWAHELGTGQPLLANAQSSPFAPLRLLALPLPVLRSLPVSAAWAVLLNLLLMHALALRLGASGPGAAFAAVATAFSTFAVAWGLYPLAMSAAWIPGVLLGLILLRRGERGGLAGLVVCAAGLATSGHPETVVHTALAALGVAGVLLLRGGPGRGRFAGKLALASVLVACLTAPALVPFLENLPRSDRMEQTRLSGGAGVQPPPFEPRFLLPLLDPLAFGSPRDANWRGPVNFNEMCSDYAGLTSLALAVAGAAALRGRVLAILLGGLAALLAGLRVPPFFDLLFAIPLLGQGANARLRLFWILAVALAAGLTLGRLPGDRRLRIYALVLLPIAGLALAFVQPPRGAPWQWAWWVCALASAAAALAALAFPRLRSGFAWTALLGLTCELFVLGVRYQPTVSPRFDLAPPPVVAALLDRTRQSEGPVRILAEDPYLLPNLAALYGLWDPRVSDPMRPFAAGRIVERRLLRPRRRRRALPPHQAARLAAADAYFGVRFLLTRHRGRQPLPPWQPALEAQGGKVWENPAALPLFFFPARVVWATDEREAFRRVIDEVVDFRQLAIGLGSGGAAGDGRTGPGGIAAIAAFAGSTDPGPQQGEVRAIRPGSNAFDLEVRSGGGGIVVSSVSFDPGWRLAVDGRKGTVIEVNDGFLGFRAPPGEHRVHLAYRPASWTAGLCLFAVGALGGAACVFSSQRASRRGARTAD